MAGDRWSRRPARPDSGRLQTRSQRHAPRSEARAHSRAPARTPHRQGAIAAVSLSGTAPGVSASRPSVSWTSSVKSGTCRIGSPEKAPRRRSMVAASRSAKTVWSTTQASTTDVRSEGRSSATSPRGNGWFTRLTIAPTNGIPLSRRVSRNQIASSIGRIAGPRLTSTRRPSRERAAAPRRGRRGR